MSDAHNSDQHPTVTPAADRPEIGARIRSYREEKGLSSEELSERSGVSIEELTAFETDARVPAVADLLNIADALAISPGHLLQRERAEERLEVVRASQRWRIERSPGDAASRLNYNYEQLTNRLTDKIMQPFLVELRPGVEPQVSEHAGEEFLFVLRGQVELTVNERKIVLDQGDSLYFDSRMPHSLRALSAVPPRLIAVVAASGAHLSEGELGRAF